MKKWIPITALLLAFCQALPADVGVEEVAEPISTELVAGTVPEEEADAEPIPAQEKEVKKAPKDGTKMSSTWKNVVIALGAVVIAVVAIVLVSSNNGHHK